MPHFTKDGSIPKPQTDGTNGWVLVPDPPTDIPDGKELVWLNWEWIIRDPKPADLDGHQANWDHASRSWVQCECAMHGQVIETTEPEITIGGSSAGPV